MKKKKSVKSSKNNNIFSTKNIKIYNIDEDMEYIKKNMGKLVKVTEKEYIPLDLLNEQDLNDIKEIKAYENIANVREKQGILNDEDLLLNNDAFLLPEELKIKN